MMYQQLLRRFGRPALGLCMAIASGCGPQAADTHEKGAGAAGMHADDSSGYVPVATFQQIMDSVVDPASKAVWDSVSTKSDATGVHEVQPRTDQDWHALRRNAILLAEAANLLSVPGRRVAMEATTLDDGDPLDIAAIQRRLDSKHNELVSFAGVLRAVSSKVIEATDKHDIAAITELGESLDEACEACHQVFWYPGEGQAARLP